MKAIFLKEWKQYIANPSIAAIMILFPVLLTFILSVALSGDAMNSPSLGTVRCELTQETPLTLAYADHLKNLGFTVERGSLGDTELALKRNEMYQAVRVEPERITLYTNDQTGLEYKELALYNRLFVSEANLRMALLRQGKALVQIQDIPHVKLQDFQGKKTTSTNYIGLSMILLFCMYTAKQSAWIIGKEVIENTQQRISSSPTGSPYILGGKVIFISVVGFCQNILVMLINGALFHIQYGNVLFSATFLLVFTMFHSSLGIFLALWQKGQRISSVIDALIVVVALLGGLYTDFTSAFFPPWLTNLSYGKWALNGMLEAASSQDYHIMFYTGCAFTVAITLLYGSVFYRARKEA